MEGFRAQRSAELDPVHPGQHQVEDYEVMTSVARGLQTGAPVADDVDRAADIGQVERHHPGDIAIVFDGKDGPGHRITTRCKGDRPATRCGTGYLVNTPPARKFRRLACCGIGVIGADFQRLLGRRW